MYLMGNEPKVPPVFSIFRFTVVVFPFPVSATFCNPAAFILADNSNPGQLQIVAILAGLPTWYIAPHI